MAKYTGPVMKKCRTLGLHPAELGIKKKSTKQPKVSRKKQSNYAIQLKEKQKLKFIYGVLEKQCRAYYEEAERRKGNTAELMLVLLESRLDNVVYRMGVGSSRAQCRQIVNHGHIAVNGSRVDIPSYQIKAGDVISIMSTKVDSFKHLKEQTNITPKWVSWNPETLSGSVLQLPTAEDIDLDINTQLIVELYSK